MPATQVIPSQPLHDTDGRVFAYFVPADKLDQLRTDLDTARRQVESLTRQRDHYAEQLKRHLLAFVPEPPSAEEYVRVEANPTDLSGLIAGLERE